MHYGARNRPPPQLGQEAENRRREISAPSPKPKLAEPVSVGETYHFALSQYEKWQRLFLSKSIDWAYEEEVRVVKCIQGIKGKNCKSQSGSFSVIDIGGRDLHTLHIVPEAVTDVYLGVRSEKAAGIQLNELRPDVIFHQCAVDRSVYELKFNPL